MYHIHANENLLSFLFSKDFFNGGKKVVIKKNLLKLDGRNISEWSETFVPTTNGRASWRHH